MKFFGFYVGHGATITKYISTITYILLALSHVEKKQAIIDDILSILYGLVWVVGICGLLINNVFYEQLRKRDKLTKHRRFLIDIFGHILPLVLIYYYGPTKTRINFSYYAIAVILFTLLFKGFFAKIYIGVPELLFAWLAPFIAITAFYTRYINNIFI